MLALCCAVPRLASAQKVDVGAEYVADTVANVTGGVGTGVRQLGKLSLTGDAVAPFDTGSVIHVAAELVHGGMPSEDLIGDIQVVDNIEAISALRLFEAYVALPLGSGRGEVRAGLMDLNGQFDVQNVGALFLNSSHGIGPDIAQSGNNGPSIFPTTASAITVAWTEDQWAARAGVFDAVAGDPDHPKRTVIRFPGSTGLLMIGELDLFPCDDTTLRIGGWRYSETSPAYAAPGERRVANGGVYVMAETRLAGPDARPLDGWFRIGKAASKPNPISGYLGAGMGWGSNNARLGLAVAHARTSSAAKREIKASGQSPSSGETNIELTYAYRLSEFVTVQPDLQVVFGASGVRGRDALAVAMRFVITAF